MMNFDDLKNKIRRNPLFWFSVFGIWLFYLWILRETPYGIDDWSWGLPEGWHALLTGELNGRYFSNLLEVVVSRSPLLKTLLIGTLAALLPFLTTLLCLCFADAGSDREAGYAARTELALPLFLLAVLLFLTLPVPVWGQTYGWIAGFSNFGFAGIILLIYQGILLRALRPEGKNLKVIFVFVFLFGICMQLVLENLTIYTLAVTVFFVLVETVRKRKANPLLLILLLGNLIGALIMFCGSGIYAALMETGRAINGMRSMKIDRSIGLIGNLLIFHERFVFFFPQSIWSNNWILSAAISLLLSAKCLEKKSLVRIVASAGFLLFALLFSFMHLIGPIERFVPVWSDVLTQRLNLLYFWLTSAAVVLLWWHEKRKIITLLFLWLSSPAVILPLTATNMNAEATRCFLTSVVFQIEFCLLLFMDGQIGNRKHFRDTASALLAAGILFCCVQRLVVYHDIDAVRCERAELVKSAQRGETDSLVFPDFPHPEYLWVNEPLGESQRAYFRAFYRIPDGVEMHFNTGKEDK